jgi:predicted short-subunit dehydrogenase-like oxidoreductase (DUF2520 family)
VPTVRVIGPGRAGRSLSSALAVAGWTVLPILGRDDDVSAAAAGVDALVIATPDDVIASVAAAVQPCPDAVLLHLSGSLGLDVLAPHPRRGALHPLVALPDPGTGACRLVSGVTFAVAGEPIARSMVAALGGRAVEVPDEARVAYHAAACVAANHLVALLGQVERIARSAGLPLDVFLPLARAAIDDVARVGPQLALTGPAARGDWQTLARHLDALSPEERAAYRAGVGLALQLTVGDVPPGAVPPGAVPPEEVLPGEVLSGEVPPEEVPPEEVLPESAALEAPADEPWAGGPVPAHLLPSGAR